MLSRTLIFLELVVAVALVLSLTGGASSSQALARFRLVEKSASNLGDFSGATSTQRTTIKLLASEKIVGYGAIACDQIEQQSPLRTCRAVYVLPEGTIVASGLVILPDRYTLLITAASGVYAGSDGSVAIRKISTSPWSAVLTISLA